MTLEALKQHQQKQFLFDLERLDVDSKHMLLYMVIKLAFQ